MPIAKETLRIGELVVARPGNFVAPSAVEHYGWQDKVTDTDTEPQVVPEPKRRVRKKTG
jgi:hypothetical protein